MDYLFWRWVVSEAMFKNSDMCQPEYSKGEEMSERFVCDICGWDFSDEDSFTNHKMMAHPDSYPLMTEEEHIAVTTPSILEEKKQNILKVHYDSRPENCWTMDVELDENDTPHLVMTFPGLKKKLRILTECEDMEEPD